MDTRSDPDNLVLIGVVEEHRAPNANVGELGERLPDVRLWRR